jgi:hypothetical protein
MKTAMQEIIGKNLMSAKSIPANDELKAMM